MFSFVNLLTTNSLSLFFEFPNAGSFIPSYSGPIMIPTIANKITKAKLTFGAQDAGVDNKPPKRK